MADVLTHCRTDVTACASYAGLTLAASWPYQPLQVPRAVLATVSIQRQGPACACGPAQDTGQPSRAVASSPVGGRTVLVALIPIARRLPRDAQGIAAAYAVDADKTEQNIAIPLPSCHKSLPNRERRRHLSCFLEKAGCS